MNILIISIEHTKDDTEIEPKTQKYKSQKFAFKIFGLLIIILIIAYYIFILTIWYAKDQNPISGLPTEFQKFFIWAFYVLLFSLVIISYFVFYAVFKHISPLKGKMAILSSLIAQRYSLFAFFCSFLILVFLFCLAKLVGM